MTEKANAKRKLSAGALAVALLCVTPACGAATPDNTGSESVPLTVVQTSIRSSFSDVSADTWYSAAVQWCLENGVMNGTSATTFSPDEDMTRCQLATILWRAAGSPNVNYLMDFSDVDAASWYAEAVRWAASEGLMSGYGNGQFGTNDPISREQMAAVLWRWQGSPEAEGAETFADEGTIAAYALPAVHWARSEGILGGVGNNRFAPKDTATRAQAAAILCRALSGEDANTAENQTTNTEAEDMETTTYTVNGVAFKMLLVEAGTFTMGSDTTRSALAAHEVTLEQDYLMGETEVTEALWNAVMGSGGGSDTLPKTSVTWSSTFTFIEKLNQIAHEQGIIPENRNFYLPTEEQWEFAARGGNLSKGYTYAGSNDIDEVAETQENSGITPVAVKQKAPNELGLYDMSGNAYEWVDATESGGHVKKGGSNYHSFRSEPYLYTPEGRYIYSSTDWTIGFRICLY